MAKVVDHYAINLSNSICGDVLVDSGVVYSCTLHQENIRFNTNKFYIMQVIYDGLNYHLCVRYGRVGDGGMSSNKSFLSKSEAIAAFFKQFKLKTGNVWGDKFVQKQGLYSYDMPIA